MKSLLAILAAVIAFVSSQSFGNSPTLRAEQSHAKEPGATVAPVRIHRAASLSVPRSAGYASSEHLIVLWKVGPACSGAGASAGSYDHIDVSETAADVRVTLYLRDAVVNPQDTLGHRCLLGVPFHMRIVPLQRPLGKRIVRDWACATSCQVRRLSKAQIASLEGRLQVS